MSTDQVAAGEAVRFLADRTGLADDDGAAAVAAELGYLPPALALAAAVITAQHLAYPAYLERLRAGDEPGQPVQDEPLPAPPGVVKAVSLSLEAARAADATGATPQMITILAVLAVAGVRREMLHVAGQAGLLAVGRRRMTAAAVDNVLAGLAERSLLSPSSDGRDIVMHRLVAAATRSWLARKGQLASACQAAAAVLEIWARTLSALRDRSAAMDFSEHVSALSGLAAGQAGKAGEELTRNLLRPRFLALYYLIELGGSAPQAIAVGESLTADLERMLGPDHPDTLNTRNSLAAAYLAAGRSAAAVPLFERTLVGRERTLGPTDPDTLTSQNNLAVAYQDDGRVGEAILLHRLTMAARERILGEVHPDTLNSCGNLASAYWTAGRTAEAVPLLERTLAGRERVLGASHPDTEAVRANLEQARQDKVRPAGLPASAGSLPSAGPLSPPAEAEPLPSAACLPAELPAPELPTMELPVAEAPVAEAPVTEPPPPVIQDLPAGPGQEPEPEPEPLVTAAGEAAAEEAVLEELLSGRPPAADIVPEEPFSWKSVPIISWKPMETAEPEAAAEPETEAEPEDEAPAAPVPALVAAPAPEPEIPGPRPLAGSGPPAVRPHGRMRGRLPWVAAVALVLIVASGAAGALSRLHSGDHSPGPARAAGSKPADAAQMAADWVSQQVSHSVTVACDPLMCAALEARGVPTARLLVLRSGASPRGAGVIVATPAIRSQLGSRLDTVYAPLVLAGFGSGPSQVNVQVVAPDGAVAYLAALRQDQAARKAAGTELLANKQIEATARARTQLAAGAVDSRVLILLPALVATHPIQVLAFGNSGPQAGPDSPLCLADLSGSGRAAGMTDAAYQRWLTSFVRAQLAHFTGTMAVIKQGGQTVVRVQFSRPSPLGLLTG